MIFRAPNRSSRNVVTSVTSGRGPSITVTALSGCNGPLLYAVLTYTRYSAWQNAVTAVSLAVSGTS
jgi:hypothetical protein